MPAVGDGRRRIKASAPKSKRTPAKAPGGDRPQTHGGKEVEDFKKTPRYRKAVRESYKSQTPKERSADVKRVAAGRAPGKRTTEQREILSVHEQRKDADRRKIAEIGYLPRKAYANYLRRRAGSKEIPENLKDYRPIVARSGLGEPGDRPQDRPRDSARVRDFTETLAIPRAVRAGEIPARPEDLKGTRMRKDTDKQARHARAEARADRAILGDHLNAPLRGGITSTAAIGEATYRDPIGVPAKTAKSIPVAVAALPAAVVGAVTNPVKTAGEMLKSTSTGYDAKVKRIREEGALEDIGNAAVVLGPSGRAISATTLAKVAPRAAKLDSGGAKRTPRKGGAGRYLIGRAVDNRKARKYEKIVVKTEKRAAQGRLAKPGLRLTKKGPRITKKPIGLTALQKEALELNRAAGRTVAVVPARSGRKIAKVVANARGKAVAALKYDSAKGPFMALANERYNLTPPELEALWLGTEVGIRDAATARTVGKALRDKMAEGRGDADPLGWEKDMDVVAQIDKILEDPEAHFTPNFAATMDRIHEHAQKIGENEPQFKEGTKENRRRAVQAWLLGLAPGEGLPAPDADATVPSPPTAMAARVKLTKEELRVVNKDTPLSKAEADVLADVTARVQASRNGDAPAAYKKFEALQKRSGDLAKEAARLNIRHPNPNDAAAEKARLRDERDVVNDQARDAYATYEALRDANGQAAAPAAAPPPLAYAPETDAEFNARVDEAAAKAGRAGPLNISGFHRTTHEAADAIRAQGFDERKIGSNGGDVAGVYFSENVLPKGSHIGDQDLPVSAQLHNPLRDEAHFKKTVAEARADLGHSKYAYLDHEESTAVRSSVRDRLIAEGYDGVILEPYDTAIGGKAAGREVIAFDPKAAQVASAPTPPPLAYAPETDADFNARVDEAAAKAGLSAPTYFRSEKQQGLETDFGARTVGGGGPKSTGKQYKGKNRDIGIFDSTWEQFLRGYAHNLKATHNYPLVAKLDDKNRLRSLSPDTEPQGKELGALMNDVNRAEPRVQKGSVVFVNKGLFEKHLDEATDTNADLDPDERAVEDLSAREAFAAATFVGEKAPTHLAKTPGWVAWPKEALRELEAELHAGSLGGRGYDIAKGTASQSMLLTMNFPWLAFQAVSETAGAGIASKGRALTPRNMVGTARMWKAMNHRQRTHLATELGLGATGSDTRSIKLGSTTNNGLANTWRDFKSEDFWHRPRIKGLPVATIISPFKWMRAADQGKTNVTRLLLAHSELTKKISPEGQDSLAGALTNMAKFGKAADRLLPIFKKPTAEQLEHLDADPRIFEEVGETVSNALGDWTTLTAFERRVANRAIMFYPFVRYSTRLLFHTLPVDHPAITGVLAELGQLKADEYREIFGNDDLPWQLGKVYFGETGDSEYIDLARANPLVNGMISGLSRIGTPSENLPGAATGMLPPYFQWLVDQTSGIDTFRAKPMQTDGDTDPFWSPPWKDGPEEVGQVALAQFQSLFYPAREAMSRLHPEAQSDDSSLIFPQEMNSKSSSEIKGGGAAVDIRRRQAAAAERNEKFRAENDGGVADLFLGPLAPRASRDKAASEERAYIKKLKDAADKKAAERKAYRDSHGGKNPPTPKSPFGSGGGKKSPFKSKRSR